MKYYAAEPKHACTQSKVSFERLWKIVPKLRPGFLKNYLPKFSKKNTGCKGVHAIERPGTAWH
jgi:hypothetical protein